jgi:hypothetical protein
MQVLQRSSEIIEEYLTVMQREVNPSEAYQKLTRVVLNKLDVMTATQENIIKCLDERLHSKDYFVVPIDIHS